MLFKSFRRSMCRHFFGFLFVTFLSGCCYITCQCPYYTEVFRLIEKDSKKPISGAKVKIFRSNIISAPPPVEGITNEQGFVSLYIGGLRCMHTTLVVSKENKIILISDRKNWRKKTPTRPYILLKTEACDFSAKSNSNLRQTSEK